MNRQLIPRLWGGSPEATWRFARGPVVYAMRALAPLGGYGIDRLPATGGAVVAANHFSGLDPTLIGIYARRFMYFMAKLELLEVPVVGDLLRWTGVFAVRRGESDRDSIRVARWVVREGHLMGMFMEGTRQKFGYPGPVHPGAVMIALQEGVPIIPCGLDSWRWSLANRRPCAVVFGEAISLDGLPANSKGYKAGAEIVEEAIQNLWRQAAVAAADGLPDRLPDGTPKSPPLMARDQLHEHEHDPWPEESWAAGPLGRVYPGAK